MYFYMLGSDINYKKCNLASVFLVLKQYLPISLPQNYFTFIMLWRHISARGVSTREYPICIDDSNIGFSLANAENNLNHVQKRQNSLVDWFVTGFAWAEVFLQVLC